MKKSLLTFLLLFFTCQLFSQVNLEKGLVAYYPFNGNVKDESGRNHQPLFHNTSLAKDRFGRSNSACSFNGRNQYIQIADHKDFHFRTVFSISAWVMIKGFYD